METTIVPQEGRRGAWLGKNVRARQAGGCRYQAGDRIFFRKYVGSEVKLDAQEHLIMREGDIMGVLEG